MSSIDSLVLCHLHYQTTMNNVFHHCICTIQNNNNWSCRRLHRLRRCQSADKFDFFLNLEETCAVCLYCVAGFGQWLRHAWFCFMKVLRRLNFSYVWVAYCIVVERESSFLTWEIILWQNNLVHLLAFSWHFQTDFMAFSSGWSLLICHHKSLKSMKGFILPYFPLPSLYLHDSCANSIHWWRLWHAVERLRKSKWTLSWGFYLSSYIGIVTVLNIKYVHTQTMTKSGLF